MTDQKTSDHYLDITPDVCPMTFVKTKLKVERMSVGETLEVRLNAGEPLENVPRSLCELGYEILKIAKEDADPESRVHRLWVRK
jgi:TusA-related sulfurtransferase